MGLELFWHPVSPPARAAELACKYAGVPVDRKFVDLMKGEQLKPEYLAMNPQHCVPTMRDGSLVMWESRAIMQYVFNKYKPTSSMYPKDPVARAKVDFLLCWEAGTLYPAMADAIYPVIGFKPPTDQLEANKKVFAEKLQFLNDHLITEPYMTGPDMTIADVSTAVSLTMPTIIDDKPFVKYPKISSWLARMQAEELYKQVDAPFQETKAAMQEQMKK